MKLALISCMIFSREVNHLIATSDNIIHSFWLEKSLHDYPDELRDNIQNTIHLIEAINKRNIDNKPFDAIVLGYGLCSNGTVGLKSTNLPLIIPKCFDCMALFLGSNQKYIYLTHTYKDIFWYNKAWIENSFVPSTETVEVDETLSPNATIDDVLQAELTAMKNLKHAIFIKSNLLDDTQEQLFIEKTAKFFKWEFIKLDGDMRYFSALLEGKWDDRLFLTCPVGHKTALDKEKNVMITKKIVVEEEEVEIHKLGADVISNDADYSQSKSNEVNTTESNSNNVNATENNSNQVNATESNSNNVITTENNSNQVNATESNSNNVNATENNSNNVNATENNSNQVNEKKSKPKEQASKKVQFKILF